MFKKIISVIIVEAALFGLVVLLASTGGWYALGFVAGLILGSSIIAWAIGNLVLIN